MDYTTIHYLIFCFRYTIHSNGTLQISQLDPDHAGVYQCFLRNEAGEAWRSTWLTLYNAPPRFIHRPAYTTVIENQEVRLPCLTQGVPKPVVVWAFGKWYCFINPYNEVYFKHRSLKFGRCVTSIGSKPNLTMPLLNEMTL